MTAAMKEFLKKCRVPPGKKIDLRNDYDPGRIGDFMTKEEAEEATAADILLLAEKQDMLYA